MTLHRVASRRSHQPGRLQAALPAALLCPVLAVWQGATPQPAVPCRPGGGRSLRHLPTGVGFPQGGL